LKNNINNHVKKIKPLKEIPLQIILYLPVIKLLIMNNLTQNALNSFSEGLNCAQSVVTTFSDKLNYDRTFAGMFSAGFGGGMGRMQGTCGAVTGSFMVLGIHNSQKFREISEIKENTNTMVQKFACRFKKLYGTLDCNKLLNCDLNTEEGKKIYDDKNLKEAVCKRCIADSISIINDLIFETP
jgi:C_GCAxxG_C_C family probable redox protein